MQVNPLNFHLSPDCLPFLGDYKMVNVFVHLTDCLFLPGTDTMLTTVTAVVRFTQYNDTVSPTSPKNTSVFPTWQPDSQSNISKPHKCLQLLYEDAGDAR